MRDANEIRQALSQLALARDLRYRQMVRNGVAQFHRYADIYRHHEANLKAELNRLVR